MSNPICVPTEFECTVSEYFEMFKLYTLAVCKDLDDRDIRVKFVVGLSLDNQKEVIRFGKDKPLSEIVSHLEKRANRPETSRYLFGEIVQGNDDPVFLFYAKIKKYNAILNLGKDELKCQFLRGLNAENRFEAMLCGEELPLEELVDKLTRIEALSKAGKKF
jgi:hypothetical protein